MVRYLTRVGDDNDGESATARIRTDRRLMRRARVLVSACLLGADVRYHGGSARIDSTILARWHDEGRIVAVCPEVEGGLGTPRPPAEMIGGDGRLVLVDRATIVTNQGRDVTAAFVAGARHAVALAKALAIRVAVLKSHSPSCGIGAIYDGTFSGQLTPGLGVSAAALDDIGVRLFDETQLEQADALLASFDRI
jgi:uncharacterized protein YbbK (DUF523 family)